MSLYGFTSVGTSFDSITTDDQYQFRPLSTSTTIRLIRIYPAKVNGHIACTIHHADEEHQEIIKYHALSYCWGNSRSTEHIYLRDQGNKWYQFQLHENLWLFLDRAWQHGMFNQYFWIDYLCIDQNAHGEKSQQVQRMHIIYRNAALVVIWLQLREKEESGLLECIDLVHRWLSGKMNYTSFYQLLQDRDDFRFIKRNVLSNPYWKRVWIVQEVVVAKEVCVYTKRISITLKQLDFVLGNFYAAWDIEKPSMDRLCHLRATGGKIPLWRMLKDFEDYECRYKIDRIYGIFGLAENNEDGSSPATNIQIDYEKPVSHVMLDVLFESSPPLNHLGDIVLADPTRGPGLLPLEQGWLAWKTMRSYINDIKTTERHRDCARIALQGLEAFETIMSVMDTPLPDDKELLANLFSSAAETDWKPTRHQNAALLGMILTAQSQCRLRMTGRLMFWDCFDGSAWRCAAHGFRDACHTGLGSYETVAVVATFPGAWSRPRIVSACGKRSQDCDGSIMTLELSEIGLRIQVEPVINSGNVGRLSFHSMSLRREEI